MKVIEFCFDEWRQMSRFICLQLDGWLEGAIIVYVSETYDTEIIYHCME